MLTAFRSSKLYERVSRYETVHQFVKYTLIGGCNVLLHLGIFNLLSMAGLEPLVANAIGFFVGSVNSFIWNKFWAFRDQRRDVVVRQYLVFVFFTIVGLCLHTGAFALLLIPLRNVQGPFAWERFGENLALIFAIPVSVAWNFTTYRLWTFKPGAARGTGAA